MTDNAELLPRRPEEPKQPSKAMSKLESLLVVEKGLDFEQEFKATKRIGQIILFVVFGIFGVWSLVFKIDGAAHAPGQITPRTFKKPIQHLEGGIVKEVKVRDGDVVKAGDVVVIFDDTLSKSQLGSMTAQLKAKLAQEARLIAERDGKDTINYPAELAPSDTTAQQEVTAQNQVFKTRRATLGAESQAYQQRVEQLQARVKGLEALHSIKQEAQIRTENDIKDFQALLKEGFTEKTRLRDLERMASATKGEVADLEANIASAKLQVAEAKIQVLQLQNKNQTEIAALLSQTQTEIKDLRERISALSDTVTRAEVRSPDAGVINNLKVHTPDTVVPSGAILAEVVPQNDELIIEAKVSPLDIDRVAVGQTAKVQMTALNSRKVPTLLAKVVTLSADALIEQNGAMFYMARLELTPESMSALKEQKLVPGMPADVMINTGSRTLFQYMTKALTDSMAHSLRED